MKSSTSVAETTVIQAEAHLRTLSVPAGGQLAWRDEQFHLIAIDRPADFAFGASSTDSPRRSFSALRITPDPFAPNHPVHTAEIGDTWSLILDGEQTPEYEYMGRFTVVGEFLNTDTLGREYVIREVAPGEVTVRSRHDGRLPAFSAFEWATAVVQEHERWARA